MTDRVRVAVRVRPFTPAELHRGDRCILSVHDGQKVRICNPNVQEGDSNGAWDREREFIFDFAYWSHDPHSPRYATQQTIFNDLGKDVLKQAMAGYNVCLFAYGQTGSGKSYSMVGFKTGERGLIPMIFEELFHQIKASAQANAAQAKAGVRVEHLVEVSMLEIYCEKVRDLFHPGADRNNLRVREHPNTGPYVEGLQTSAVTCYEEVNELLKSANCLRTVASTRMNASSSRAHTIVQVIVTQRKVDTTKADIEITDTTSHLNLVDLAGSERTDKAGTSGQQLKEGSNINKSLLTLSQIIRALAEEATEEGKKKKGSNKLRVPYRDSMLTWLLKESLGGNSKTIMIAALGPSEHHYHESLSTLRYADSAKAITNVAVVNEDANQSLIRALEQEIEMLKTTMSRKGGAPSTNATGVSPDVLRLREQLAESERLRIAMACSWEERVKASQAARQKELASLREMGVGSDMATSMGPSGGRRGVRADGSMVDGVGANSTAPQLINLNEDPLLAELLVYGLQPGTTRVGTPTWTGAASAGAGAGPVKNTIQLTGLSIKDEHCVFEWKAVGGGDQGVMAASARPAEVTLCALEGVVYVNGQLLKAGARDAAGVLQPGPPRVLTHSDRVILGTNHVFRFHDPVVASEMHQKREAAAAAAMARGGSGAVAAELLPPVVHDWAFAQRELAEQQLGQIQKQSAVAAAEEFARKEAALRSAHEQEIRAMEERVKREKEEGLAKLRLEQEAARLAAERELEQKKNAAAREELERRNEELRRAQQQLLDKHAFMELELVRKKRELEEAAADLQRRQMLKEMMDEKILAILPLINEVNQICEAVQRKAFYKARLTFGQMERLETLGKAQGEICVDMFVGDDLVAVWSEEKFLGRVDLFRALYMNWVDSGGKVDDVLAPQDDPFWDEEPGTLIGSSQVYLKPLTYLVSSTDQSAIIDAGGNAAGSLLVQLRPCGPDGDEDEDALPDVERPEELLGQRLDFKVEIKGAAGLGPALCRNVYVRYTLKVEEDGGSLSPYAAQPSSGRQYSTGTSGVVSRDPKLSYLRQHTINPVTMLSLDHLQNEVVRFEVFGFPRVQRAISFRTLGSAPGKAAPVEAPDTNVAAHEPPSSGTASSSNRATASNGANSSLGGSRGPKGGLPAKSVSFHASTAPQGAAPAAATRGAPPPAGATAVGAPGSSPPTYEVAQSSAASGHGLVQKRSTFHAGSPATAAAVTAGLVGKAGSEGGGGGPGAGAGVGAGAGPGHSIERGTPPKVPHGLAAGAAGKPPISTAQHAQVVHVGAVQAEPVPSASSGRQVIPPSTPPGSTGRASPAPSSATSPSAGAAQPSQSPGATSPASARDTIPVTSHMQDSTASVTGNSLSSQNVPAFMSTGGSSVPSIGSAPSVTTGSLSGAIRGLPGDRYTPLNSPPSGDEAGSPPMGPAASPPVPAGPSLAALVAERAPLAVPAAQAAQVPGSQVDGRVVGLVGHIPVVVDGSPGQKQANQATEQVRCL
eukprot:jgi/Mesvir1/22735/Mv14138-RA.3